MNSIRYSRSRRSQAADINMAPLIDMVFLLLIFFLVTTSFVRETGVDVQRPTARTSEPKEKSNMLVGVTEEGLVFIEGKPIDVRSIRPRMRGYLSEVPEGSVVIVADRDSQTGTVIQVLDECRLAGVQNISIAARNTENE